MEEDMIPVPGSVEAKDSLAVAPPGHSLTIDNEQWAWGKPAQVVNPEAALSSAIDSLEVRQTREEMMMLLMVGASVEALTEDEMDDQTFFRMMEENNPAMFAYVADTMTKGIRQGNATRPPTEDNFMNMKAQEEK